MFQHFGRSNLFGVKNVFGGYIFLKRLSEFIFDLMFDILFFSGGGGDLFWGWVVKLGYNLNVKFPCHLEVP